MSDLRPTAPTAAVRVKPRLRGVSHELGFYATLAAAPFLALRSDSAEELAVALVFVASAAAMFGASALYHRPTWSVAMRRRLCRVDHATIYLLIAGTYTPCAFLVLDGAWRAVVLAIVYGACGAAALVKALWVDAPKWLSAATAVAIGSVGFVALPKIADVGAAGLALLVLGGGLYALGALVYALRRPDPRPAVFGYHEIFHLLVVAAVACDYAAVGWWVLPHR